MFEKFTNQKWRYDRIVDRISRPISRSFRPDTFDIVGADWDVLVVLDACRADLFESVVSVDYFADYRRINSAATSTQEWSQRVWAEDHLDIAYTSATPAVQHENIGIFGHFSNPWIDHWDETHGTMPPEPVAKEARKVADQHPDKRQVIHFLQPHHPFVFADDDLVGHIERTDEGLGWTIWDSLREGDISREDCWKAYGQNLKGVLEVVFALIGDLPGRIILTSDHGNAIGEHPWWSPVPLFGHPHDVWLPCLYEVPWAVVNKDESLHVDLNSSFSKVSERLAALGYA